MLQCTRLNDIRISELDSLRSSLYTEGYASIWNVFINSELNVQLRFILGSNVLHPMPLLPEGSYEIIDTLFDRYCKSYIKKAWSLRTSIKNQ